MSESACSAAIQAVVPQLNALFADVTLPVREQKRLLLRLGADSGLLVLVAGERAQAEPWHSADPSVAADTTVHVDSVDTLQHVLADESKVPVMLLRRKIRLHGDLSWLEQLQSSTAGQLDASTRSMWRTLAAEVSESIAAAVGGVSGQGSMHHAVPWLPNEASLACMCCTAPFSAFRRRHHCRGCGQLFCAACAPRRRKGGCFLAPARDPGAHARRLCQSCSGGSGGPSARTSFISDTSTASTLGTQLSSSAEKQLEELKAELKALRHGEAERGEMQARDGVAQILFVTQLVQVLMGVALLLWCSAAFAAWAASVMALRFFPRSSVTRNVHIFWTAFVIWLKLRWTRQRIRSCGLEEKEADAEWQACHKVLARFLFEQISTLGGFWTKFGQQFSVNAALPAPYLKELSKLLDRMPRMPIEDVLTTVREEFGASVAARLTIDPQTPPLGSASVAQVHRAAWLAPGAVAPREIVVKVQHRGVEQRFRQDLRAAGVLAWLIARCDPEGFPDPRPIVSMLCKVTWNELDFRLEAANQARAAQAVREHGVDVLVPAVVPELVARRAIAMEFVDGVPLGRVAEELPHVDRSNLVAALVDHYGVQFVVDGHFHADPHPGNLLVERSTGQLTVLDWGMCVTLPRDTVQTYAKVFYATATSDLWLLIHSFEALGITFKEGDVFEPFLFMELFRFILRDSQPMSMARGEMEEFIGVSDDLYWKGPKRYQKSPVDVFTGDLLYFGKALDLLYSVSSQLDVKHPILQTLFRRSYAQLLCSGRAGAAPLGTAGGLPRPLQPPANPGRGPLEQELLELLQEAQRGGRLLGAQLCVLELPGSGAGAGRGARVLADIALGQRGQLEPEPVERSTPFNLLDLSKLPLALALLRLVDAGKLRLDDALADRWPGFGGAGAPGEAGRTGTTVEHVLSHTAGMWRPLPPGIDKLPQLLDFESMLSAFGAMPASEVPGTMQRYHYASFGYLCAGICRYLAGCEVATAWDMMLASAGATTQAAGGIEGTRPSELLLRMPADPPSAHKATFVQKAVSSADLDEVAAMMGRFAGMTGDGTCTPVTAAARELWGREHLVDLSLFSGNAQGDVPAALLPGLQAFGTARSVAQLLAATATGSVLSPGLVHEMLRSRRPAASGQPATEELAAELGHVLRLDGLEEWGLGAQLVPPKAWAAAGVPRAPPSRLAEEPVAWGHLSQAGSVALVLPGARPRVVVLLLNLLGTGPAHSLGREVLRRVASARGDSC